MPSAALSDRTRRVLATLIRDYIDTGEPVASATLSRRAGLGVSSATIRNVLAQLEDMGYVSQPHTSAGRVPTDLGYRYYVNMLLEARRATRDQLSVEARMREHAGEAPLFDQVLSTASHVLFEVSHHVGFAIAPSDDAAVFQRIDFVPLSQSRVLVVMVTQGDHVTQKVVDIGEAIAPSALTLAANYLNGEFAGRPLTEVRGAVVARLEEDRSLYDQLLALALRLARTTLEGLTASATVFIDGASTLADGTDDGPVSLATLRKLLRMVEEKQRLVKLLDAYLDGPGLAVVIGAEHPDPDLHACSVVVASYSDGARRGAVGIIGPTRMQYSRAINVVDGAAVAVARLLRDEN
ncbi:MAG: heat-inducible transcriptional repressor HrcA [Vicinamibacterales bacterium]